MGTTGGTSRFVGVVAAVAVLVGVGIGSEPARAGTPEPGGSIPDRSRVIPFVGDSAGCGIGAVGDRAIDGDLGEWPAIVGGVNGTGRLAGGEYVWTDYVHDDVGTGELVYPGEYGRFAREDVNGSVPPLTQRYGNNAADVVEARVSVRDDVLVVAIEMNFLNAVDTTILGLAFDTDDDASTGAGDWPLGARVRTPGADAFVTTHPTAAGYCATVTTAAGDVALDELGGAVAVDTAANGIEVAVPLAALGDPATIAMAAGTGLWDARTDAWQQPVQGGGTTNEQLASRQEQEVRGGLTASDPALFNVLFRGDEVMVDPANPTDAGESGSRRGFEYATQAAALRAGTTGDYALRVAIGDVEPGGPNEAIPDRRGDLVEFTRQYESAVDLEGILWVQNDISLDALYLGRRQSYAVQIPPCLNGERSCPPAGVPVAVSFHGGGGSHINQLEEAGTADSEMAERSDVLTMAPFGRGRRAPSWRGLGEVDVFEAMADLRSAFPIDGDRILAMGASLGGYGTFRFAALYPDVWAGAAPVCPSTYENTAGARTVGNEDPTTQPFTVFPLLGSLVNTPVVQVSGTIDPLVRIESGHRLRDRMLADGVDIRYTEWFNGTHCFFVPEIGQRFHDRHVNEMLTMLAAGRDTRPAVVRYAVDPRHFRPGAEPLGIADIRDVGVRHDGAWWVDEIVLTDEAIAAGGEPPAFDAGGNWIGGPGDEVVGTVSAVSHAIEGWQRGVESCGDEVGATGNGGNPEARQPAGGATGTEIPGGHHFVCQRQTRSTPALEDVLDLVVDDVASLAIDATEAGLPDSFTMVATGNGPTVVRLDDSSASAATGSCVDGVSTEAGTLSVTLLLSGTSCAIVLDGGPTPVVPEGPLPVAAAVLGVTALLALTRCHQRRSEAILIQR